MEPLKSSSPAVATLTWLIQDAFEGDPEQSIIGCLRGLRDEDWTSVPPGAERSIVEILEHVGWCKWMYENYAFGTADLRGDRPPITPPAGTRARPRDRLLAWLKEGHARWRDSVRALPSDAELDRDRLTNWGERLPTRVIIRIMIGHDFYHAGEINHIRALLQGNDHWPDYE